MNSDIFEFTATSALIERIYTLPKNISAIQILPSDEGERTKLGLITQLPEGGELVIGGPGFSEGTIKVRCGAAWYFVFLDDLDWLRKPLAAAHA